jgi:hypothetical protein
MFLRHLVQIRLQLHAFLKLRDRLAGIHLVAGAAAARVGRQQHAFAGTHRDAVLGLELGAETGRLQALVVALVQQVAQVQLG